MKCPSPQMYTMANAVIAMLTRPSLRGRSHPWRMKSPHRKTNAATPIPCTSGGTAGPRPTQSATTIRPAQNIPQTE